MAVDVAAGADGNDVRVLGEHLVQHGAAELAVRVLVEGQTDQVGQSQGLAGHGVSVVLLDVGDNVHDVKDDAILRGADGVFKGSEADGAAIKRQAGEADGALVLCGLYMNVEKKARYECVLVCECLPLSLSLYLYLLSSYFVSTMFLLPLLICQMQSIFLLGFFRHSINVI